LRRPRRKREAYAQREIQLFCRLSLGQVIYGNVGVPERLQFVGAAVNEVVRVQDLSRQLGYPLLATAPFAGAAAGAWRPLKEHLLRGFETPMSILTMPQP
jgi:adenylate cyclase